MYRFLIAVFAAVFSCVLSSTNVSAVTVASGYSSVDSVLDNGGSCRVFFSRGVITGTDSDFMEYYPMYPMVPTGPMDPFFPFGPIDGFDGPGGGIDYWVEGASFNGTQTSFTRTIEVGGLSGGSYYIDATELFSTDIEFSIYESDLDEIPGALLARTTISKEDANTLLERDCSLFEEPDQLETSGEWSLSAIEDAGQVCVVRVDGVSVTGRADDGAGQDNYEIRMEYIAAGGFARSPNLTVGVGSTSPESRGISVVSLLDRDLTVSIIDTDSDGVQVSTVQSTTIPQETVNTALEENCALFSNKAPSANAGVNQVVADGVTVNLSGTASSDPDQSAETLSYSWRQVLDGDFDAGAQLAGIVPIFSTIELAGADTATPSFTSPELGPNQSVNLRFELTVTDDGGLMSTDFVEVLVEDSNAAPDADAGENQDVTEGDLVNLDGTGSSDAEDAAGDLSYSWVQVTGDLLFAGPSSEDVLIPASMLLNGVNLTGANTATPSFQAPFLARGEVVSILTFQLTVTDSEGKATVDFVEVRVAANKPPVADAGSSQVVDSGVEVCLDGSGSLDPEQGTEGLTYLWSFTPQDRDVFGDQAPLMFEDVEGVPYTLDDPTSISPCFTSPTLIAGSRSDFVSFTLTVTDALGAIGNDSVQITTNAPENTLPSAVVTVTPSTRVESGTVVTLDGSGSSANDFGQLLSLAWSETTSFGVNLSRTTGPVTSFTTPTLNFGDDPIVVTILLSVSDGFSGNAAGVNITVTPPVDEVAPVVTLSGAPETVASGDTFDIMVAFSEDIQKLNVENLLDLTNAEFVSSSFGEGGLTVTLRATGPEGETVEVFGQAGGVRDVAGNPNVKSNTLSVLIGRSFEDQTKDIVEDGIVQNNLNLSNSQPSLTGFVNGGPGGTFNGSSSSSGGNAMLSLIGENGGWVELQGVWSEIDGADSRYFHGALGAHRFVSDTVLLGGMLQFDTSEVDNAAGDELEFKGWLIGPYIVGRVPGQNLYYEARVLAGRGTGDATLAATGNTGSFDTERFMFMAKLEGDYDVADVTLFPYLSVMHLEMEADSYTDSGGLTIAASRAEMQQAEIGLTARFPIGDGSFVVSPGFSAVGSRQNDEGQDARGKATLGLYKDFGVGYLTADAFFDGLGRDNFESYGLTLRYQFDF